jgi:predicted ribosome quality control (RQC) complex YloA/Tae2 family protein
MISNFMNSFWSKDKSISIFKSQYLAENLFLSIMENGSIVVTDLARERIIHVFEHRFDEYQLESS